MSLEEKRSLWLKASLLNINSLQLSEKVSEIVKSDRLCVTVGGDHSIGVGTVFGHASAYPEEVRIQNQFF